MRYRFFYGRSDAIGRQFLRALGDPNAYAAMMRAVWIGVGVAVVGILAMLQFVASVALRDRAQTWSWVHLVPAAVGTRVDAFGTRVPMPLALRLVLARVALSRGDLVYAREATAALGESRDRSALEAEIAERQGDTAGAVRAYLAAGDLAGIDAAVARLEAAGRASDALALQMEVVRRLESDRTQIDALAQAYYGLGRVTQTSAYALAPRSPKRRPTERRALDAYERALRLAPLSMRYLIAVANQAINVDDLAKAQSTFERARDRDPTSAEPLTGLGDVALRRGDRATSRAMLERARAIDPNSAAVHRLELEVQP